ncbi:MAG: carboxypeptidase-like regulatory domain-containing protein, partial [Bacteroidales bacterium]|nr:carboxypeptidase-like regulatory domain-containing protein [Bacteroidales bacterium]
MRKLTFLLTFVLFVGFSASAQMQITGTVTNAETGEPIPGVSVVVQGQTTIGTSTDMDGNYSLQVPSDAETLVFTFVGMQRVEADIDGRSTINIEMVPTVEEMEEVIVLGYTSRGKNQITGS